MHIDSIQVALPSQRVTNADILREIRQESERTFSGDLDAALRKVEFYLKYSGSEVRRWLGTGETPIALLSEAVENALEEAQLSKFDIDVVIYVGIGRGFIEPGGAYHAAAALGIENAQCFDLIDACMSWTRALSLLQAMFSAGDCKHALVVNAEFNMLPNGPIYPHVFRLPDEQSIEWSFPAFTLGEAATATVLSASSESWEFRFKSRPDWYDLCNIPILGYEGYSSSSDKLARNGVGRFTSFGFELHARGNPEIMDVLSSLGEHAAGSTAVFTHASSKREWHNLAKKAGLEDKVFHIYQDTGNVVSASIPAAISLAAQSGSLARGERAIGWAGSAGMSFAAFSFTY